MKLDDLLRSPKKRATLLYVYGYQVFAPAHDLKYAHEHAPDFIKHHMTNEVFLELLEQLALDGFIEQKISIVPKSDTMNFVSEFKTTVKGNRWIHSRLIDPLGRKDNQTPEELIRGWLSPKQPKE